MKFVVVHDTTMVISSKVFIIFVSLSPSNPPPSQSPLAGAL